jgi:predicted RNA methylase
VFESCTTSAITAMTDTAPRRTRAHLLGPARSRRLTSPELTEVGRALYGDTDLLALYGVAAEQMEARWLHLLGRTVAECTVDRLCVEAAATVAGLLAGSRGPRRVVDLFAGSGNIAFHLSQAANVLCHASEVDPQVYRATRHNLGLLGAPVYLHNADYRDLLGTLTPYGPDDVYIVDPPWRSGPAGRAGPHTSLALRNIVDNIRASRHRAGFILITTIEASACGEVLRSLGGATLARSISFPAATSRGQWEQLHVYTCEPVETERLAG